jgi:hypothetical protein
MRLFKEIVGYLILVANFFITFGWIIAGLLCIAASY